MSAFFTLTSLGGSLYWCVYSHSWLSPWIAQEKQVFTGLAQLLPYASTSSMSWNESLPLPTNQRLKWRGDALVEVMHWVKSLGNIITCVLSNEWIWIGFFEGVGYNPAWLCFLKEQTLTKVIFILFSLFCFGLVFCFILFCLRGEGVRFTFVLPFFLCVCSLNFLCCRQTFWVKFSCSISCLF